MDVFERIIAAKRADLDLEKRQLPMRRAIELSSAAPPPHTFAEAMRRGQRINIIAELRGQAPVAEGEPAGAGPADLARACAGAGAAAISVLTDARFLRGSPAHLEQVRAVVDLPILRKDFIFDEYQIYRSRALGTDAILLIARALDTRLLATLIGVTLSLHMEALVEVHAEDDLKRALDGGASMISVNNREPGAAVASIETSLRLAPLVPPSVVRVSGSGIETRADIDRLRAAGYDAFLLGERLTREADPAAALRAFVAGEAA